MIIQNQNLDGGKAWVVAVSMGYGHQRTAYPLRNLAPAGKIVNANNYENIPPKDKKIWEGSRKFYEFISNFRRIPLIGPFSFYIFDQFQKILSFYPRRDLSAPNFQVKQIFKLIQKGWGGHLIETLAKNPLPLITTFFTPAFMAEFFNYPGEIYCVICDADLSRAWVSLNPYKSRIKYFAPNERVVERLKLYGVRKENIFLTGYPLPKENIGLIETGIAKFDLGGRLLNLDPENTYRKQYASIIQEYVGILPKTANHPFTILFSIGGAGAQKEIGIKILKSLEKKIKNNEMKLVISVGTKEKIRDLFIKEINGAGLKSNLGRNIEVLWDERIENYFKKFNEALRTTDILWTKPSELSFYAGLGLPIVIAPPLGSQEIFNRDWLIKIGAGLPQENPAYANEWLFDFLKAGWFAEAAMHGFIEAEKMGTFNIEKIIISNQ